MGRWLRKARLQRGHTLRDVGDAIGRNFQYVCDVEHGRRGHKMDPLIAMLWAEYLILEPQEMFTYLGYGGTDLERFRVAHYLESTAWAHRYVRGRKELEKALPVITKLWEQSTLHSPEKAEALQVRDAIKAALRVLRAPQKDVNP